MIDTSTRNDNAASDRSVDTAKAQDAAAPSRSRRLPLRPRAPRARPARSVPIERVGLGVGGRGHRADGKTVFVEGAAPGDVAAAWSSTEEKSSASPAPACGRASSRPRPTQRRRRPGRAWRCAAAVPWAPLAYEAQLEAKRANVVDALVRTAHLGRGPRRRPLSVSCVPSQAHSGATATSWSWPAAPTVHGRLMLGLASRRGRTTSSRWTRARSAHRNIEAGPQGASGRAALPLRGRRTWACSAWGCAAACAPVMWRSPCGRPRFLPAGTRRPKPSPARCKNTSVVRVVADPGRARKVKKRGGHLAARAAGRRKWPDSRLRLLTRAVLRPGEHGSGREAWSSCVLAGLEVDAPAHYVADLYAGAGTFTLPLARAGADVVAVESAGSSVRDLRRNAERAGADIDVIGGDAARELPELGELDALVVDPPRAGLAEGVVASIAAASPAARGLRQLRRVHLGPRRGPFRAGGLPSHPRHPRRPLSADLPCGSG